MTVQKLSSISFNGTKGEAYGGNIYSFRIESNGIESPASYIISVAYPPGMAPSVSLNTSAQIKIKDSLLGNNLKLFSQTIEDTPEYSCSHLKYVDNSSILDKTYIGLNYRHGRCGSTYCGNVGGMVILGGEIAESDLKKECINCQDQIVEINNTVANSACDVRDVAYTISDFNAVFGGVIQNIGLLNNGNLLSYVGTLREVLSNLCSDTGNTFMVDHQGGVIIIDGSQGISIEDIELKNNPNIKKKTRESSLEGTYSQGEGTFSITPMTNISQTRENYTQIILNPINNELSIDVILGLVGMRGPLWRDAVCKQMGLYHRLGFYAGLYSVDSAGGIYQNNMKAMADCMQDSSLMDLGNQYDQWYLTRFSDELKNYYINLESEAANNYGSMYRANAIIPATDQEKQCLPNSFRKTTTYEIYPDISPDGTWKKNVSPVDIATQKIEDLAAYYAPVIVPLVGELSEKYALCGGRRGFGDMTNAAFVGWKSNLSAINIEIGSCTNPSEELKKPINQRDTYCILPCEEQSEDPCKELNSKCISGPAGIFQGSASNQGTCIGGIVLPSNSIFYGWIKKTEDITKNKPEKFKLNDEKDDAPKNTVIPYLGDTSVVESVRFSLIDVSNTNNKKTSTGSLYLESKKITYEIIGEFVPKLHPSLASWNITVDDNGVHTTVSYQNRPPIPSKQDSSLGKTASKKILLRS